MEFGNKVALVTGGARGIGRATALAFAREGASVAIADVVDGGQVADQIRDSGREALFVQADLSSADECRRVVRKTAEVLGGIDFLNNNAGIVFSGSIDQTSESDWQRVLDINLSSLFWMSKYALPQIRNRGGGAIVNISSVHAFQTHHGMVAYCTSKAGVVGLTRAMAIDHGSENIRVNAICPGAIDTPMMRKAIAAEPDPQQVYDLWGKSAPVQRVGQPEDIAEAVLFLCSSRASFITGQAYLVDGGLTCDLKVQ